MHLSRALDVIGGLLRDCDHPEIEAVERFGADAAPGGPSPAGLRIRYVNGALAYLWGAIWPGETDLPAPDRLPPPRGNRPDRAVVLAVLLLDAARPPELRSWQLVALPELGPTGQRGKVPRGLRIVAADGTSLLLRVTAAGGPERDPEDEPYPDWRIPAGPGLGGSGPGLGGTGLGGTGLGGTGLGGTGLGGTGLGGAPVSVGSDKGLGGLSDGTGGFSAG